MPTKKILFISDNFNTMTEESGYFNSLKELIETREEKYDDWDMNFELTLSNQFNKVDKRRKYDAVFIDYGFIENCFDSLEFCLDVIDGFYSKNVPLVWNGGLSERYNRDAQEMFPRKKYLHDLLSCSIASDEIFWILEKLFKEQKE